MQRYHTNSPTGSNITRGRKELTNGTEHVNLLGSGTASIFLFFLKSPNPLKISGLST